MNHINFLKLCMLCASVLAVAGCAQSPNLDRHFGETLNRINAQQTLNPVAAGNTDPVQGLDGGAAMGAYGAYQKSYKAPEPPTNVFNIGVSSSR